MLSWEYRVVHTAIRMAFSDVWTVKVNGNITGWDMIQELGTEGWELVNAFPIQSNEGGTVAVAWIFKRAVMLPVETGTGQAA